MSRPIVVKVKCGIWAYAGKASLFLLLELDFALLELDVALPLELDFALLELDVAFALELEFALTLELDLAEELLDFTELELDSSAVNVLE